MKYLDRPQLREKFGIRFSAVHLRRLERAGQFPQRVHLGRNSVAWLENEIIAWCAERNAAREAA